MINSTKTIQWHESKRCNQLYTDEELHIDVSTEFNFDWVCPNIRKIEVDNNPILFESGDGTAFVMVANACQVAKIIE